MGKYCCDYALLFHYPLPSAGFTTQSYSLQCPLTIHSVRCKPALELSNPSGTLHRKRFSVEPTISTRLRYDVLLTVNPTRRDPRPSLYRVLRPTRGVAIGKRIQHRVTPLVAIRSRLAELELQPSVLLDCRAYDGQADRDGEGVGAVAQGRGGDVGLYRVGFAEGGDFTCSGFETVRIDECPCDERRGILHLVAQPDAPGSVGAQRAVDGRHAPPAPELAAESGLACRQGDSVKDVCAVVAADVGVGDGGAVVACAVAVLGDVVGDFGGAVTDFEGRVAFRCTVCGRSLEGEDGARGIAHGV
jgi:hypothetical protein